LAARERAAGPFVRAALRADADRSDEERRRAAFFACALSAPSDADARLFRSSRFVEARLRFAEGFRWG
jgi:hypothetical protein